MPFQKAAVAWGDFGGQENRFWRRRNGMFEERGGRKEGEGGQTNLRFRKKSSSEKGDGELN